MNVVDLQPNGSSDFQKIKKNRASENPLFGDFSAVNHYVVFKVVGSIQLYGSRTIEECAWS